MTHARHTLVGALPPEHPLAGSLRRPGSAVVILVAVLALIGWTEEQILALLAVLVAAASQGAA